MEIKLVGGVPQSNTIATPGSELLIDPTWGAARVKLTPTEINGAGFQGGHYRLAASTGALTGVAAAGAIFSMRWGIPQYKLLKKLSIAATITTVFTTAQAIDF